MLRRFALTMLLATTTSVLAANQPGEARRNRAEAAIPPLVLPPLVLPPLAVAEDEIDEQAQVVELAAIVPAAPPSWSVAVAVDARTRCALGPSVDCLANDARLRAVGIVLDPDEPAAAEAAPPTVPTPRTEPVPVPRAEPAPSPVLREPVAPPRLRAAALRAFTPEIAPTPAPVPGTAQRREPDSPAGSSAIAPIQWRIAQGAWLDLRPRTELMLARGQAANATVPNEPVDGGPPIPGAARLRLGISVPLEALRTHAGKPLGATTPPPGVAQVP